MIGTIFTIYEGWLEGIAKDTEANILETYQHACTTYIVCTVDM